MGACTDQHADGHRQQRDELHLRRHQRDLGGAGQRLGAPGPQNLSSPIQRNGTFAAALLDATVAASRPAEPGPRLHQRSRRTTPRSGRSRLRRRFVNNTGGNVTRLRFRVVDITTFPAPSGFADLRPRTSASVVVGGHRRRRDLRGHRCAGTPPCTVTVQGTTLETPPAQPNGSGFNGSVSAGTVTLGTPLANGASINLQLLNGIQQTGNFKLYLNIEALP